MSLLGHVLVGWQISRAQLCVLVPFSLRDCCEIFAAFMVGLFILVALFICCWNIWLNRWRMDSSMINLHLQSLQEWLARPRTVFSRPTTSPVKPLTWSHAIYTISAVEIQFWKYLACTGVKLSICSAAGRDYYHWATELPCGFSIP